MIRPVVVALLIAGPAAAEGPRDPMPAALETLAQDRFVASLAAGNDTLAAFSSDGCSGGLSAAWDTLASATADIADTPRSRLPVEACCVMHDGAYHDAGGARTAEASIAARLAADEALRQCVIATGAARSPDLERRYGVSAATVAEVYDALATAMFRAVRLGGAPCSGLSWRWGYGYPDC